MKWIEIYKKLVNIDTGPDLPFEEKLRRTSFLTESSKTLVSEWKKGKPLTWPSVGNRLTLPS